MCIPPHSSKVHLSIFYHSTISWVLFKITKQFYLMAKFHSSNQNNPSNQATNFYHFWWKTIKHKMEQRKGKEEVQDVLIVIILMDKWWKVVFGTLDQEIEVISKTSNISITSVIIRREIRRIEVVNQIMENNNIKSPLRNVQ